MNQHNKRPWTLHCGQSHEVQRILAAAGAGLALSCGAAQFDWIANPIGSYDSKSYVHDVAISGRYAYVAERADGLLVLDISDPASPRLVGQAHTSGLALRVALAQPYAYLANDAGLLVVNIEDPTDPRQLTQISTTKAESVAVEGDHAYVADGSGGLRVFGLEHPEAPNLIATYPLSGYAKDIAVSGGFAYVACGSVGVNIVDVRIPDSPQFVGNFNSGGVVNGVTVLGNYVYLTDQTKGLRIVSVLDPVNPLLVGSLQTTSFAQNVKISGKYAFIASFESGLLIVDVSDPKNPRAVAGYDSNGQTDQVAIAGCHVYLADGYEGMKVVDVSGIGSGSGSSNLIRNGDFEAGALCIESDYFPDDPATLGVSAGSYVITPNATTAQDNFVNLGDHTPGPGTLMMVVNGSQAAASSVWKQSIPVQPNRTYSFAVWTANVCCDNGGFGEPGAIQLVINGSDVGGAASAPQQPGVWQEHAATWNSGTATVASLELRVTTTFGNGNDFAFDDLSFVKVGITTTPKPVIRESVQVSWTTFRGESYQVQWAASAEQPEWMNLGEPVAGDGTTKVVYDLVDGSPRRFYRITLIE